MHMPIKSIVIIVLVFYGLISVAETTVGMRSTDQNMIKNLSTLLNKKNIPHSLNGDYIGWTKEYAAQVEEARNMLSSYKGILWEENEVREYFKSLLTKDNKEFIESERDDGIWILWWPKDDAESEKYELETIKYKVKHLDDKK